MLIWASIAKHAAQVLGPDDTLFFVTSNHSDFCDDKDRHRRRGGSCHITGADAKRLASFRPGGVPAAEAPLGATLGLGRPGAHAGRGRGRRWPPSI